MIIILNAPDATVVVEGTGNVGKERCFQCHFETERLDKYDDVGLIHSTHISKHSLDCSNCHSQIEHKIQKIDPNASPDCNSCHSNATSQVSLFSGRTDSMWKNHRAQCS
ncbi:MAG: hypothetical protein IPL53_21500 [Ignavibacteria bacterium]|nr:hypothetical protein [Ignavibacteria bacterium]